MIHDVSLDPSYQGRSVKLLVKILERYLAPVPIVEKLYARKRGNNGK